MGISSEELAYNLCYHKSTKTRILYLDLRGCHVISLRSMALTSDLSWIRKEEGLCLEDYYLEFTDLGLSWGRIKETLVSGQRDEKSCYLVMESSAKSIPCATVENFQSVCDKLADLNSKISRNNA